MSWAILKSDVARVLSWPWASTMASWAASASNLLGAVMKSWPVILLTSDAMSSAKPVNVLIPVPTAVPPCASILRRGRHDFIRSTPNSQLLYIARELLAQRQGCGVLQMRPANLDEVLPLLTLALQGVS